MTVLLINPHTYWKSEFNIMNVRTRNYSDNLSIRYLAASLEKNGHEVELIDGHFEELELNQILDRVFNAPKYDLYAISSTEGIIEETFAVARTIKEKDANALVCVGGYTATFLGERILYDNNDIDILLVGEGEYTIVDLVNNLDKRENWKRVKGLFYRDEDGQLVQNPFGDRIENLNELPWPKRADTYKYGKANMLASRGCYGICQYCSITEFHKKNKEFCFRIRDAKDVVDEMEYLNKTRGVYYFDFVDDSFMTICKTNREWLHQFCYEMEHRNLGITWGIQSRAVDIEFDILKKLHRVGLRAVSMGIENNVPRVIQLLKTGSNDKVHRYAVECLQKLGIDYYIEMILIEPTTSLEEILENLSFLDSIHYCDSHIQQPITVSTRLKLYIGTPVVDIYKGVVPLKFSKYHIAYEYMYQETDVLWNCLIYWQNLNKFTNAMHISHPHFIASKKGKLGLALKAVKLQKDYLRFDMDVYRTIVNHLIDHKGSTIDEVMNVLTEQINQAKDFEKKYEEIFALVQAEEV